MPVAEELSFALGVSLRQLAAPLVRIRQALAEHYGVALERRLSRLVKQLDARAEPSPNESSASNLANEPGPAVAAAVPPAAAPPPASPAGTDAAPYAAVDASSSAQIDASLPAEVVADPSAELVAASPPPAPMRIHLQASAPRRLQESRRLRWPASMSPRMPLRPSKSDPASRMHRRSNR